LKILGIETSCDETGAAIIHVTQNNTINLLSNVVSSSLVLHSKTGGIIPEVAAREQVKYIIPAIDKAIKDSNLTIEEIDAIGVTVGPGLIGSLLVGVETAKTLAYLWKKPLIPVNHLIGHIYANFISKMNNEPLTINFPAIALIVSGGHTDLVLISNHQKIKWLGGTRDDAAGEAFDKIGRLLGIPYPAGAETERLAKNGNKEAFTFPRPMIYSKDFDFSFSGLKTAVWRETKTIGKLASPAGGFDNKTISDICACVQQAIIDVLIKKTLDAAQKYKVKSILLGGGVAANQKLRDELKLKIVNCKLKIPFFAPEKWLCTDNAAMIATAAFFNYKEVAWQKITANPELYFE